MLLPAVSSPSPFFLSSHLLAYSPLFAQSYPSVNAPFFATYACVLTNLAVDFNASLLIFLSFAQRGFQ